MCLLLDPLKRNPAIAGVEIVSDGGAIGVRVGLVPARLVEDKDAVAKLEGLFQIVADHENGHGLFGPQLCQKVVHRQARTGVERPKGFVQQKDPRGCGQRLPNRKPLLHAAGQGGRVLMRHMVKPDPLQRGLSPLARGALGGAAQGPPARGKALGGHDVLKRRHMRENRIALKDDAALGPGLDRWRVAVDGDRAARRVFLGEQQAEERRLPAPRGPNNGDEFAFFDIKIDPLDDRTVAVGLEDIAHLNKAHPRPPLRPGPAGWPGRPRPSPTGRGPVATGRDAKAKRTWPRITSAKASPRVGGGPKRSLIVRPPTTGTPAATAP